MVNKKLKSDKFVVFVEPAGTGKPLIRIFKCNDRGKMTTELVRGGFYQEDCVEVGKAIIDNSKNIADFKDKKIGK